MRRQWTAVVVIGTALLWAYGAVIAGLVHQWRTDENYSHGFLVVPIALVIGWQRRERLQRERPAPSRAGFALVLASLLVLVAGRFAAELFLTRLSLIGVIAGTVGFVWGRAHLR